MSTEPIEVDLMNHADILVRGHEVDVDEFIAMLREQYGYGSARPEQVQRGFVRILPGGRLGTTRDFDQFYVPAPAGGRGAARVTAFCGIGSCRYAPSGPAPRQSEGG